MARIMPFLTRNTVFWVLLFAVTWALSRNSFAIYKALDARWIIRRIEVLIDNSVDFF